MEKKEKVKASPKPHWFMCWVTKIALAAFHENLIFAEIFNFGHLPDFHCYHKHFTAGFAKKVHNHTTNIKK